MAALTGAYASVERERHQTANLKLLANLRADDVVEFQVGSKKVVDRAAIEGIVAALNQRERFRPNHGGWGEPTDFVITLADGTRREWLAAHYERESGVVIFFRRRERYSIRADGNAFSRSLVAALASADARLPGQP